MFSFYSLDWIDQPWQRVLTRRGPAARRRFSLAGIETLEVRCLPAVIEFTPTQVMADIKSQMEAAPDGTTFYFAPGTYNISGIVLTGQHDLVGVAGKTVINANFQGVALTLSGMTGTVSGIEFTAGTGSFGGNVVVKSGSNVFFSKSTFSNGSASVAGAGMFVSASDVVLADCQFSDNRQRTNPPDSNAYLGNGAAISVVDGARVTIGKCRFYDNIGWGDGAISAAALVAGPTLHTAPESIKVIDCTFDSNGSDFNSDITVSGATTVEITNCSFSNDFTRSNPNSSIAIFTTVANGSYEIANNVFYNGRQGVLIGSTATGVNIENNIFSQLQSGISAPTGNVSQFNLFHAVTQPYTGGIIAGAGDSTGDPLFINPGALDFSLGAGSPAISGGDPAVVYRNWDGSQNNQGRTGGTPPDSILPHAMPMSFDTLTALAAAEAQTDYDVRPAAHPSPTVDALNYTTALDIQVSPLADIGGHYLIGRPRAAGNQGGDVHELGIYVFDSAAGTYIRKSFEDAQVNYAPAGIDDASLPPSAFVLTNISIGAPDPLVPGSFPLIGTMSGDDGFLRISPLGMPFGTSERLPGAQSAFFPGEDFPYVTAVYVTINGDGTTKLNMLAQGEAFTCALEVVIEPGRPTTVTKTGVWFARHDIDVDSPQYQGLGLKAYSTMYWKGLGDTPNDPDDSAHDADTIQLVTSTGEIVTVHLDNPDVVDQIEFYNLTDGLGGTVVDVGLLQVDRNAAHYAQYPVDYANRPSYYVHIDSSTVPLNVLYAIQGTPGETRDNVALLFKPQQDIVAANSLSDGIRIRTTEQVGLVENLANQPPTLEAINAVTVSVGESIPPINLSMTDDLDLPEDLAVTVQPSNQSLLPIGNLAVNGTGSNRTLTISPFGSFTGTTLITVTVTDPLGGTASRVFRLTIVPQISDIPNLSTLEDTATGAISFNVEGVAAAPGNTSITAQSFDTTLIPNGNIQLSGSGSNRTITLTPTANLSGTSTITVTVNDGVSTVSDTFVVTVIAVNDAPSFTKGGNLNLSDTDGPQMLVNWATGIAAGPTSESGQIVDFQVTNDNPGLFEVQPAISSNGTLTFTAVAGMTGSATVTVRLHDDGGVLNGGVNLSAAQSFVISVVHPNHAPTFSKGSDQTVDEDSGPFSVAGWASSISSGPSDPAQSLEFIVVPTNPTLFAVAPTITASGTLSFTPAPDAFGISTITVTLKDDGGTANGGDDTSDPQTFTVTILAVNDAPSFVNGVDQILLEDAGPQNVAGWATQVSAGAVNESSQLLIFDVIGNTDPELFSVAPAIQANGTLTYAPTPNANGAATITIRLRDNGGTVNGGVDTAPTQSFLITVNPVNDAPSFAKGANQSILEDAGPQTVTGWAQNILAGPPDEVGQSVTFNVAGNTNPSFFQAQPAITSTGTLTYTIAPDANGTATISITLRDNGGTANGGSDTSTTQSFTITVLPVNDAPSFTLGANQVVLEDASPQTLAGWATNVVAGPANESGQQLTFIVEGNTNLALFSSGPTISANGVLSYMLAANANGVATISVALRDDGGTLNGGSDTSGVLTFTVTVTPVNDAPSFAKGNNQDVQEDDAAQVVLNWAMSIMAGPPDEANQSLTFNVVSNSNPGLFAVVPAITASGTLSFTPAPDAFGTSTITVMLKDGGGTANGGDDTSDLQTFTVTIRAVNDVPSFVNGADQILLEDAGPQTSVGWASQVSAGPANESGQLLTFSVIGNTNTDLFSVSPAIQPNGTLTYTLAPNANGDATITVQLSDDGGTLNGGVATSPTQTFVISVTPVNDSPTFSAGPNLVVLEDAGPLSIPAWASAISAGPANESEQSQTFLVSSDHPELFSAPPTISANGTLTFTPAANANGLAVVTVQLQDDGGTANGGSDITPPQTLQIQITPVNDVPSFRPGADIASIEDQLFSMTNWASELSPGPANESSQTLQFVVTVDRPELFSVGPTVGLDGTFSFTPAPNANGQATATIWLKDSGGTENGGIDISSPVTIQITLTPVPDSPTLNLDNAQVNEELPAGTIVGVFSSTDPDEGDTFNYALVSGPKHGGVPLFKVVGTELQTNAELNFESQSQYTVHIRVTDSFGESTEEDFLIQIIDGMDRPVVTLSTGVTTLHKGKRVTIDPYAVASDEDTSNFKNGRLTISLASGGQLSDRLSFTPNGKGAKRLKVVGDQLRLGKSVIGAIAGGQLLEPLRIHFTGTADLLLVNRIMNSIRFATQTRTPGTRNIEFLLQDGTGLTSHSKTKAVVVS